GSPLRRPALPAVRESRHIALVEIRDHRPRLVLQDHLIADKQRRRLFQPVQSFQGFIVNSPDFSVDCDTVLSVRDEAGVGTQTVEAITSYRGGWADEFLTGEPVMVSLAALESPINEKAGLGHATTGNQPNHSVPAKNSRQTLQQSRALAWIAQK